MLSRVALAIALFVLAGPVVAAEGDAARAAIQATAPLHQVSAFRASALPGYFEGFIDGKLVYASADGRYVLRGTVEDRQAKVDLSEASMAELRRQRLASLGPDQRLRFGPAETPYRVTVFTDVDCPFCRNLHTRIDEYVRRGIAIDYVFFPLSSHVGAGRKMLSVWCASDRQGAYTSAVRGGSVVNLDCPGPLAAMHQAGIDIGVERTPTAIADDGSLIDSRDLMSPQRLLDLLKSKFDTAVPPSPAATAAAR